MSFELAIMPLLDSVKAPAAFLLWMYGFIALTIGLVVLLSVTGFHFFSARENRIPEGGLPPFLMTLFIGGAQISLLFSTLQMVTASNGTEGQYVSYPDSATSNKEREDYFMNLLRLTAFSTMFKVYIVQFLRNNQEWAGPAKELKKLSVTPAPTASYVVA